MSNAVVEGANIEPEELDNQEVGTSSSLFPEEVDDGFHPSDYPGEITEEETGEPEEGQEEGAPKYYTPEEMRSLSEEEIDTSRIPPEMLPFYKALQGNYTKKHQQLAEAMRQHQAQASPQKEPGSLDEAFDRDPVGVMRDLDKAIAELTDQANAKADTDPFGAVKLQNKVLKLTHLKDQYRDRMFQAARQHEMTEKLRQDFLSDLNSIPDFSNKQQALTEFALNELGYTADELAMLANPAMTGKLAGKFVKSLNAMYDKVHGKAKSAGGKQVKTTPPPLLRSAGGAPPQRPTQNVAKLFEEAKQTGNWEKYLRAKGY